MQPVLETLQNQYNLEQDVCGQFVRCTEDNISDKVRAKMGVVKKTGVPAAIIKRQRAMQVGRTHFRPLERGSVYFFITMQENTI